MRVLVTLVRNLVVALFTGTQNLLKTLWIKPQAPDYVTFELTGHLAYRPVPRLRRLFDRVAGRPTSDDLQTLGRRFDALAGARRVRGVVLRLVDLEADLPKVDALREHLARLRAAGKEVVVWTPEAGTREALLLLAADRAFLAPAGRLDLRGFAVEGTTARAALEKVGARATVFQRGAYKSAGEIASRDGMSPEAREDLDGILDDLYDRLLDAVAEGRGIDRDAARARVDDGPYTARRAVVAGLADGVCYGDELPARLAAEGQRKARLAPWAGYRATRREPIDWKPVLRRRRLVAVVPVRGLITEGESRILATGGRVAGARSVAESLEVAREEPSVKAVVLHVDSRGGSPLASDLIWREVRRTAEKKPVVAFLDSVAASGGYYVAAGASRIVASPAVLTGSIGVIAALFDVSGLLEKVGVTREILARGENAALGTPSRAPTDGERAAMDRDLDEIYADFIARVAEGRGMDEAEVARRAEGRVYTGIRAEKVGLVDELGGFEDAVARAREMAGLAPEAHTELVVLETAGPALLPRLIRRMGLAPRAGEVVGALAGGRVLDEDAGFDLAWALAAARRPASVWAVWPLRRRGW